MTNCLAILLLILPVDEARILDRVAKQYKLTTEQTYVLAAIRKTENGPTGLEFGIGQEYPGHKATRYKHSPARSFWIQARWAAGTVAKRYTGDVPALARIYCPKNHEVWAQNVRYWMNKQMEWERRKSESIRGNSTHAEDAG